MMDPEVRTKHDVVTEFRCSEIVRAARKVFSKKDFRDATVDEIAEVAGLAKGTVYQYFPSKQEIFLAALRQGIRDLVELTRGRMEQATGVKAKIEAFVRTRLEYLEENRDFFNAYHAWFGSITHPASLNTELRDLYQAQLDYLASTLRQARERGEIETVSVETAASTLYEATRGLMLRRVLGWSKSTVDEDIEALTAILWKGIGAP
jgi:AcrR family transcriptional regulator